MTIENKNEDIVKKQADDEIDLIQLAKTLWNGRKTVIKTTILFMALGLFIALFSAKEYTSTTTMVPQSSEGGPKLGGLGGLAAMAGINLGSSGEGITPKLYPKITGSIPFQLALLKTKLTIEGVDKPITFQEYYTDYYNPGLLSNIKKYTIGLPGIIVGAIRGKDDKKEELTNKSQQTQVISISEEEDKLLKIIKEQISLNVNDKDNYITLSATMPQAMAAAQMAKKAQILLQNAITKIKIEQAKGQLQFVQERYNEKQKEAERAQLKLARFRDRNKNVTTATAATELERLQAEYTVIYGVYSELAKQLEAKKIQVTENTPVFSIIEPVAVPRERSKPKRGMILVIWTFLGIVLGVGIVFGREWFSSIKNEF